MVLNMIDLTTLEGKDTQGKVRQMCYKAHHLHDAIPNLPAVAAVCVYPSMVKLAKKELRKRLPKKIPPILYHRTSRCIKLHPCGL